MHAETDERHVGALSFLRRERQRRCRIAQRDRQPAPPLEGRKLPVNLPRDQKVGAANEQVFSSNFPQSKGAILATAEVNRKLVMSLVVLGREVGSMKFMETLP